MDNHSTSWRDVAQDFARRKLTRRNHWLEGDEYWQNARLLAEHGFLGVTLPEAYGGAGLSPRDALGIIEEFCRVCPTSGRQVYHTSIGTAAFIHHLGTEQQKRRYLPEIAAGRLLPALGMTEPDAGSATTDLKTTATDDGNTVVLDGSKIFVSEGDLAGVYVVYARFGRTGRARDIGAVLVDRDTPGLTVGPPLTNMSGEHQTALYFDHARVPKANVLVSENAFSALMGVYNGVRLGYAAQTLGIARGAFDLALAYVKERRQFGKALEEFQGLQWMVADIHIQLEACRTLLDDAARQMEQMGSGAPRDVTSVAKVFVAEAAKRVTDDCLQLFGGYGFSQQLPLEWYYRCVRAASIAGGTVQIHRNMIASHVLGRRFDQRR